MDGETRPICQGVKVMDARYSNSIESAVMVGSGVSLAVGLAVMVGVYEAVGVSDGVALAVSVGVSVGVSDGAAVSVGTVVGVQVAVGVRLVGLSTGDGLAVGVAKSQAARMSIARIQIYFIGTPF
jgi:hypothetical protein